MALEVHHLPGGPVNGAAATELLTRHYFSRPDVAATLGVVEGQRVQFAGLGRDALARVAGIGGPGVDPWALWLSAVEGPRYRLSSGLLGEVSAQPEQGLTAAVRDTLDLIVRHDWQRSGAFWMAAAMVVDGIDYRPRRHWIAQGSVQDAPIATEAGEPAHSPDAGARGWRSSDLRVAQRKERRCSHGSEYSTWAASSSARGFRQSWRSGTTRSIGRLRISWRLRRPSARTRAPSMQRISPRRSRLSTRKRSAGYRSGRVGRPVGRRGAARVA